MKNVPKGNIPESQVSEGQVSSKGKYLEWQVFHFLTKNVPFGTVCVVFYSYLIC